MERINLDKEWTFRRGFLDSLGMLESVEGTVVNLPHDSMIGTKVDKDTPSEYDWGYFRADRSTYTKYVFVPAEWENESVGLRFDGVMMNMSVDVNGSKVGRHHYGYSPFFVDISDYITFGEENRITINCNTGIEPSSRWYPGTGIYRSLELCHGPRIHIANDGVFIYTKELDGNMAFLEAHVDVVNDGLENRLVELTIEILSDDMSVASKVSRVIHVKHGSKETAIQAITVMNPKLWDAENPNLYTAKVTATDIGVYRTHLVENTETERSRDVSEITFGIRTITVDAVRGLRINSKTVKLKGGCLHHDNGLLGAVSLYAAEERKIKKLKEIGFNAIRTAHNPPSTALVEACDRIGMYILDEAFDSWGMEKRIGDYSNYFELEWEKELTNFIKRDKSHPSVIMWSVGNEIPERGGLSNGYALASAIVKKVKELDVSRPVTNGICSLWSGLDDYLSQNKDHTQNAAEDPFTRDWEGRTEPFTNGLDVVGYNYLEDRYELDHKMYPERVILGTETFPQEIGFRWPMVEALDYVIGDFTWTAWDYLGEAGIGKALYLDKADPIVSGGPWAVMPPSTTVYPWRTANDADYDITGAIMPQGEYRSVVWGSNNTYLYSMHPDNHGKAEVISMWGFPLLYRSWNYSGYEKKPVDLLVFTNADQVELYLNGKLIEKKDVNKCRAEKAGQPFVNTVNFSVIYEPGVIEAVSYKDGCEISRAELHSSKKASKIVLKPEKTKLRRDGHDLIFVGIDLLDEDGDLVSDAEIDLNAEVIGDAYLVGFGTGNPITEEDYTEAKTVSFGGHAMAIVRAGYEEGEVSIRIWSDKTDIASSQMTFRIE